MEVEVIILQTWAALPKYVLPGKGYNVGGTLAPVCDA